jgi:ribosomal protein S18 acetylase RimI-like enzyme
MCVQITIDTLRQRDLQEINDILNNPLVLRFFNFSSPPTMDVTSRWFDEVLKYRESLLGECVVARNNDGVLGWIYVLESEIVVESIRQMLDKYCLDQRRGYVAAIAVDPKYWGRGIGKMLMIRGEEFLGSKKIKFIWLGTHADNSSSNQLYEHLGYKLIGSISKYRIRKDGTIVDQHIYLKQICSISR